MPVYERTYRTFDGEVKRHFRWWSVVKQELRILRTARPFVVLMVVGGLLALMRLFQIIIFDTLATDPTSFVSMAAQQVEALQVNPQMWFDFLRQQAPIVFVVMLYAGSGMICDDLRNNLLEIYFSKPLSWWDYVIGKFMTLLLIGLALTGVPAILFVFFHNILAPGMDTFRETWWLVFSSIGYSLVICVPCALGILASSALFNSQRFAGIAVFMILFGNLAFGVLLEELLRRDNVIVIAFPFALNRLGEVMFGIRFPVFDLHWGWPLLYVLVVSGIALYIVCRRVRKAEMG